MTALRSTLRAGDYRDSIVLMQLRAALEEESGVGAAGAVMASPENLALLEASDLLPELPEGTGPSDLLVVVRAESREAAEAALARVDELLERDRDGGAADYRPRSLSAAARMLPSARWVLVSVPGRFAADVAREALELERHVFLFSDNVPVEAEVELKALAGSRGLLLMGPDCGTALIRGVGFGFANRVRRGDVGIVAASGTGLQAVACAVHARGGGVSHAIGTGGRDLSGEVGGASTLQGLDLLARDPDTRTIVLVSKPPAPRVAERVLGAAAETGKPVVVRFVGLEPGSEGGVELEALAAASGSEGPRFARGLSHAAELAVGGERPSGRDRPELPSGSPLRGYLRGLFAGGTLAHEALALAARHLGPGTLRSNLSGPGVVPLTEPWSSRGHTVLDLGADAFTSGRPHPMVDQETRIRRLAEEAGDPDTAFILLDVVLGDGAHPDPAAELAPVIAAAGRGRELEVGVVLVGTERDPQDLERQASHLASAGATVFPDVESAMERVLARLGDGRAAARDESAEEASSAPAHRPAPSAAGPEGEDRSPGPEESDRSARPSAERAPDALERPVAAINVGVEAFHRSLVEREVPAIHVEWRPPAGGDERLGAALRSLRS